MTVTLTRRESGIWKSGRKLVSHLTRYIYHVKRPSFAPHSTHHATIQRMPKTKDISPEIYLDILSRKAAGQSARSIETETGVDRRKVKQIAAWFCVLVMAFSGCEISQSYRLLPPPPPESPAANLPKELHQKNWLGTQRQGSCVYASLTSHARWQNNFNLAAWARQQGDGEYASRLRQKLNSIGVKYAFTEQASPEFLDWANESRRGCILWWKPSHCCTFMGYVRKDGKTFCAILDNNNPGVFELTERSQFLRLWASYGGFGLSVLGDPASPIPYMSYTQN